MNPNRKTLAIVSLSLLVAACGGGSSGSGVASAPLPPPPPSAAPAPQIFASPVPQEYAVVGASTTSAGDGYADISQDARLIQVSLAPADQPRIRYTSGGYYEVQLPGSTFDRLIHYKGLADPTADNNFFQPQSAAQNGATLIVNGSARSDFSHSELASWTMSPNLSGFMAFGTPTPASAVPTTGRATYSGPVLGMVDVTRFDGLYGGYYFSGVTGDVTLNVDFGSSTLDGALTLVLNEGIGANIGTFALSPVSLSSGSNGFAGSFVSAQPGFNEFRGLFTGPGAQEAIGSWAIPVMWEGQPHQVIGAWIARRGN